MCHSLKEPWDNYEYCINATVELGSQFPVGATSGKGLLSKGSIEKIVASVAPRQICFCPELEHVNRPTNFLTDACDICLDGINIPPSQ